jgi:hypothetical protein
MTNRKGAIVLSVFLSFSIGHCVICPSVLFYWPLCYLSFCPFLLAIVLSVLPSFSIGHCVICPSVLFYWPLCYLSFRPFLLAIVLSVLPSVSIVYCVDGRTDNTMANRKGRKDR